MKTLVILAGGKSSRMGTDKTFLEYNGRTFLQILLDEANKHFGRVIIAGGNKEHALKIYEYIKASGMRASIKPEILEDKYDSIGPMGGIMSVFEQTKLREFAVTAVDCPNASMEVLAHLLDRMQAADDKYDEMHPVSPKGHELPKLRLVEPDESLEDILQAEKKLAEEKEPPVAAMLSLDGDLSGHENSDQKCAADNAGNCVKNDMDADQHKENIHIEACAAAYSRRAYDLMKQSQELGEFALLKALGMENIESVHTEDLKKINPKLNNADLERAFANINCIEEYKSLMTGK